MSRKSGLFFMISSWLVFLLPCLPAKGQHHLSRFGAEQGLSESHVFCALQDRRGFMWFGTRDGLNRFDGYEFKVYRHNPDDPHSLSNNYIYSIWEDSRGDLWIATNGGGLNRFDYGQEKFTRFRHDPDNPNSLSHDTIHALAGYSGGGGDILWIGTLGGGLNRLAINTGQFTHFRHDPQDKDSLGSDNIWSLATARDGTVWVGTQDVGLNRKSQSGAGKFTRFSHQAGNPFGLTESQIWVLHFDQNGVLWMGSADGLKRCLPANGDCFETLLRQDGASFGQVMAILTTRDNTLWLGTEKHGLYQWDQTDDQVTYWQTDPGNPRVYAPNDIMNLFQDNEENIWVATHGSGVSLLTPSLFSHHRGSQREDTVVAVLLDRKGELLVGSEKRGLLSVDSGAERASRKPDRFFLPTQIPTAILEDRRGNLWVGTESDGLNRIEPTRNKVTNYRVDQANPNSLSKGKVETLFEDADGVLWVGTREGLNRMEPDQPGTFTAYRNNPQDRHSLSDSWINCIYGDSSDRNKPLWIGTFFGGLNRMALSQPGRVVSYRPDPKNLMGLSSNTIFTIEECRNGFLWLGTPNGLNRFDPQTGEARSFLIQAGLDSNIIYSILEDQQGFLWMGTSKGLSRFDPLTEAFRGFNRHDGLAVEDFRPRCGFRDLAGNLYFGGVEGVVAFHPSTIVADQVPPKMVITSFLLNNEPVQQRHLDPQSPLRQSIGVTQEVQLAYNDRDLSFRFVAIQFSAPKKNRHMYKLQGYDDEWIETNVDDRRANYTNLDPGTYSFHIKGSNKDGVWSEVVSLTVHIPRAPWLSWWAWTIYVLVILGLVAWFLRQQRQQLAQERRLLEKERRASERLRQVDTLKDEFLANTSHELRTPLNGIIGLGETLIDGAAGATNPKMSAYLSMMVSSAKRLSSLVDDILDFAKIKHSSLELHKKAVNLSTITEMVLTLSKPMLGRKNVKLVNSVPQDLQVVLADENRIKQVLHNLVGNAVKFTEKGSIEVSARVEGNKVRMDVTDTGIGIAQEKQALIFQSFEQVDSSATRDSGGTGLGLTISQHLVNLHGGRLSLRSKFGEGSTFSFTLPLAPNPVASEQTGDQTNQPPFFKLFFEEPEQSSTDDIEAEVPMVNGQYRVMVVDDDVINRQVLISHLALQNYQTHEVSSGAEALSLLESGKTFDLILLDVMMPGLSGFDVCRKIREKYTVHELPVLFLSAKTRGFDMVAGFDVGANDYITKPINKNVLLSRVRTHLELLDTNRNLETKVAERTHDLLVLQKELVDSARSAGMSEIATEVLHNMGNNLNSVKTSGYLIQELVANRNAFQRFEKVVDLLSKSPQDVNEFLQSDQRREKLASVLERAMKGLDSQWQEMERESERMQTHIHTIWGVLHQQQDYILKEGAPLETVELKLYLKELLSLEALVPQELDVKIFDECPSGCLIQVDKTKFKRIFLYLLTNAHEAISANRNDQAGHIEIRTEIQGQRLRLDISDNGIGIAQSFQEKLFEPGFSTKKNYQGFGLHYCANAMAIMSGEICIDSEGLGKGTRVSLYFPLSSQ